MRLKCLKILVLRRNSSSTAFQMIVIALLIVFGSVPCYGWSKGSFSLGSEAAGSTEEPSGLIYSRSWVEGSLSGSTPFVDRIGKAHFSLRLKGIGSLYYYDWNREYPSRPYVESDLTEGLACLKYDSFDLEAGYKIISWGEMIGGSIVDLTNPRDLREPSQLIKSENKLASPMLYTRYVGTVMGALEAYVSPTPAAARAPYYLGGLAVREAPDLSKTSSEGSNPSADDGEEKSIPTKNLEYGARWGVLFGGMDMKLLTFRHRSRLPLLIRAEDSQGPHWEAVWPMEQSQGVTASYAFDYVVLRGEYLNSIPLEDKTIPLNTPKEAETNQGNLAVDFTYGNLLVGFQRQMIVPVVEIPQVIETKQWQGMYIQYQLNHPYNLSFNASAYKLVKSNDMFHKETIQYEVGEHTRLTASWEWFIASREPLLLLLEKEDRMIGGVTFIF
ncbi:MAG: hypothetical protein HQK54_18075 [Oligoflexales bacterium]|nr:hypothetical protein [Oligoflexales bacterium]